MRYLTLTFLILTPIITYSQKQGNIWYFGYQAGLDFNSGSPVVITDGQTGSTAVPHVEGTSVISDSMGNLLFYTDGTKVWNRNHQVMPNGTGLMGLYSSTQSALIVPAPVEPDRYYYVFTVGVGSPAYNNDARYSIVDMCLDNGYGDLIANKKNILLGDSLPEKLAVTRHANGTDYWVLTHKHFTNDFWAFLLTSNGIADTVISSAGSVFSSPYWETANGQMKFSPNGQHVAISTSNITTIMELFDFDNSSGVVSNAMDIETPNNDSISTYGIEFSPDNSKLYINGRSSSGSLISILAQYDISSGNLAAINSSMYLIYQNSIGIVDGQGMQLGPDEKIYMPSKDSQYHLSVINNPNDLGTNCNYQDSSIYLNGKLVSYGLTSFIAGFDYSNNITNCNLGIKEKTSDEKSIIKIVDSMGRETEDKPNTLLIYIYSDGTTEKVFRVE